MRPYTSIQQDSRIIRHFKIEKHWRMKYAMWGAKPYGNNPTVERLIQEEVGEHTKVANIKVRTWQSGPNILTTVVTFWLTGAVWTPWTISIEGDIIAQQDRLKAP